MWGHMHVQMLLYFVTFSKAHYKIPATMASCLITYSECYFIWYLLLEFLFIIYLQEKKKCLHIDILKGQNEFKTGSSEGLGFLGI